MLNRLVDTTHYMYSVYGIWRVVQECKIWFVVRYNWFTNQYTCTSRPLLSHSPPSLSLSCSLLSLPHSLPQSTGIHVGTSLSGQTTASGQPSHPALGSGAPLGRKTAGTRKRQHPDSAAAVDPKSGEMVSCGVERPLRSPQHS